MFIRTDDSETIRHSLEQSLIAFLDEVEDDGALPAPPALTEYAR